MASQYTTKPLNVLDEVSDTVIAGVTAPYAVALDSGSFEGTVALQVSEDDGVTWTDHYIARNGSALAMDIDHNDVSNFGQNVLLRLQCTAYGSGTCTGSITVSSYTHTGIVQLNTFTSATQMSGTVLDRVGIASSATKLWAEGAWSDYRGYPTAVASQSGRLVFGQDLWLQFSATNNDYDNHYAGVNDDDAIAWDLSQGRQNPIQWLQGERGVSIIAGTLGMVFELSPVDQTSKWTPSNHPRVESAVSVACQKRQPILAGTSLLFPDRTGRHLHEALYDYNQDTLTGPTLTQLAEHITGTGINRLAYQETPYPIVWCVLNDGDMAALYYSRPYQIAAWSRFVTDGDVVSVAVVPTNTTQRVWICVKRTVDGSDHYYVEYLSDLDPDLDAEDFYYVDSGLAWDGGAAVNVANITNASPAVVTVSSWPTGLSDGDNVYIVGVGGTTDVNDAVYEVDDATEGSLTFSLNTLGGSDYDSSGDGAYTTGGTVQIVEDRFSGLLHLANEDVAVYADGTAYDETVDALGAVILDDWTNTLAVGLPFTSIVEPMEINIVSQAGSLAPHPKQFVGLLIDYYNSVGGSYGLDTDNLQTIDWTDTEVTSTYSMAYAPLTGSEVTRPFGGGQRDLSYVIVQNEPYPLTLRAVEALFRGP